MTNGPSQNNSGNYASYIPLHVLTCMDLLNACGFESFLVGGAVRDLLLGSTPADFDVTTDAKPAEMMKVFAEYTTIPTGIAHGTITVLVDGSPVEITTYRMDGIYSDSRRPDSVHFCRSLEEDVKRRDFTINAIAMDSRGVIADYTGGQEDLCSGLIRCVGNPDLRLKEDALRILRALRFSAVLGFSIEKETRSSLFCNKKLLGIVSAERVWAELSGLICGKDAERVLRQYVSILGVVIPEILPMKGFLQHNPHHRFDVWEHTVRVVGSTPAQKILRLAALFHDSGKPYKFVMDAAGIGHFYGHQKVSCDIAHTVLMRLKSDTRTREQVETLVLWHDLELEPTEKIIRRRLNQFGEKTLRELLALKRADTLGQTEKSLYRLEEQARIQEILDKILFCNLCFSLKDLALTGEDLLSIGAVPGREIGSVLNEALQAVIDGDIPNDRDTLLSFARKKLDL